MMNRCFVSVLLLCLAVGQAASADEGAFFASLRKDEVNLRTGPGEKFPIVWVYQERGYPVEVIDKFDIWRQIREADGTIGWVHRAMIGKTRTALIQEESTLLDEPVTTARPVALVQQGTIGKIERCPADVDYCLLSFTYQDKEIKGWFPRRLMWGTYPHEEID